MALAQDGELVGVGPVVHDDDLADQLALGRGQRVEAFERGLRLVVVEDDDRDVVPEVIGVARALRLGPAGGCPAHHAREQPDGSGERATSWTDGCRRSRSALSAAKPAYASIFFSTSSIVRSFSASSAEYFAGRGGDLGGQHVEPVEELPGRRLSLEAGTFPLRRELAPGRSQILRQVRGELFVHPQSGQERATLGLLALVQSTGDPGLDRRHRGDRASCCTAVQGFDDDGPTVMRHLCHECVHVVTEHDLHVWKRSVDTAFSACLNPVDSAPPDVVMTTVDPGAMTSNQVPSSRSAVSSSWSAT